MPSQAAHQDDKQPSAPGAPQPQAAQDSPQPVPEPAPQETPPQPEQQDSTQPEPATQEAAPAPQEAAPAPQEPAPESEPQPAAAPEAGDAAAEPSGTDLPPSEVQSPPAAPPDRQQAEALGDATTEAGSSILCMETLYKEQENSILIIRQEIQHHAAALEHQQKVIQVLTLLIVLLIALGACLAYLAAKCWRELKPRQTPPPPSPNKPATTPAGHPRAPEPPVHPSTPPAPSAPAQPSAPQGGPIPGLSVWRQIIRSWPLGQASTQAEAWAAWDAEWGKLTPSALPVGPLAHPYPALRACRGSDAGAPTREEAEAYLTTDFAHRIAKTAENKVETARNFIDWARQRADGRSLLLTAEARDDFWFIGDVHGDLSAVIKALCFIRSRTPEHRRINIVFLGDLIDRGADSWGVVAIVQQMLMAQSDNWRVFFIRGNHDHGFSRKDDGSYTSNTLPAEAADELNAMPNKEHAHLIAEAFLQLVRTAPCMGELLGIGTQESAGSAILFCHGGLPHVDLQQQLFHELVHDLPVVPPLAGQDLLQGLHSRISPELYEKIVKDFIWLRLTEMPHKSTPETERNMGYLDVNMYRRLHYLLTGRCISTIIRGHDHEQMGYSLLSYHSELNDTPRTKYQRECHTITINSMEAAPPPSFLYSERDICLAFWSHNSLQNLVLHAIPSHRSA